MAPGPISASPLLPTAYVVRREGYVLTRVCPSDCPHLGGGYPSQVQPGGGGVPEPGPGEGVPEPGPGGGVPQPGLTGGGYPTGGVPYQVMGVGYPNGVPWVSPQPGQWGVLLMGGYSGRGYPEGGVPHLISTWYAAVSMPLAVHAGGLSC